MILNLNQHDFSIIWEGVYYKALADYPHLSDWEIKSILDFIQYEEDHNRQVTIKSDETELLKRLGKALQNPDAYKHVTKPNHITECTACLDKGCLTEYVCHTASLEHALKIFESGSLLSAVKARKLSADILAQEPRNAAKDPADYFDYVMFAWGNCQAGDRLVMERDLKRLPTEEDLSTGFSPGIRFYFKYEDLKNHPQAVMDGYHALKVKDEVQLAPFLHIIIAPKNHEHLINKVIPPALLKKVLYIEHDVKDIWEWSKKVYDGLKEVNKK